MARIKEFVKAERERYSVHDGIAAQYYVFERDGRHFFQLDTHGRSARKIPGKTSQSIQLDESSAKQLVDILKKAFKL